MHTGNRAILFCDAHTALTYAQPGLSAWQTWCASGRGSVAPGVQNPRLFQGIPCVFDVLCLIHHSLEPNDSMRRQGLALSFRSPCVGRWPTPFHTMRRWRSHIPCPKRGNVFAA